MENQNSAKIDGTKLMVLPSTLPHSNPPEHFRESKTNPLYFEDCFFKSDHPKKTDAQKPKVKVLYQQDTDKFFVLQQSAILLENDFTPCSVLIDNGLKKGTC